MKTMKRNRWIIPILFLVAVFLTACEDSPEQNAAKGSNKDKAAEVSKKDDDDAQKEKESRLSETGDKPKANTKDIIKKPEYNSFEGYVSSSAKNFNGQSEMWDIYADEADLKEHLDRTSGLYLRHFKALGEVPDDLQGLVNEGIEASSPFEDLFVEHNREEVEDTFNQLKSIFDQLDQKIQKKN